MKKLILIAVIFIQSMVSLDGRLNTASTQPQPIKAIVFDFGGVMAKRDKSVFVNYIQQLFKIGPQEFTKIYEEFKEARKARVPETAFWKECARKYHVELPDDFETQLEQVKLDSLSAIQGMPELVKFYKDMGYQVALLSNVGCVHAQYLREQGYYDNFAPVLLSFEIDADKPDPRAFEILLDRLGVSGEDCIFIDDKQENVDAAKTFGIDGIVFSSCEQIKTELERRLNKDP